MLQRVAVVLPCVTIDVYVIDHRVDLVDTVFKLVAVCWSVLQGVGECWSVLKCVGVWCSVVQCG